MNFNSYLVDLGLHKTCNILVHASFEQIKRAFPQITPAEIIDSFKKTVTRSGSIIFPTFTYCFKKSVHNYEVFDPENSRSKVGLLSETFRLSDGVKRTASPTHSFSVWGKATGAILETNSPQSPLGKESVLEWLTLTPNSFVLMLGTDFSSLSYGHYLEIESKIPWCNFSTWEHLNVLEVGVSIQGEMGLKEIPGCSKSFVNFEKYLVREKLIVQNIYNGLKSYLISIEKLHSEGVKYFNNNFQNLLCSKGECKACDSRRQKYLEV